MKKLIKEAYRIYQSKLKDSDQIVQDKTIVKSVSVKKRKPAAAKPPGKYRQVFNHQQYTILLVGLWEPIVFIQSLHRNYEIKKTLHTRLDAASSYDINWFYLIQGW